MSTNSNIDMARFFAGEMSAKEEITFRDQYEGNPKKLIELRTMEKTWKYFDETSSRGSADSGKAWGKLYQRLEEDGLLEQQTGRSRNLLPFLRAAASVLLILAVGIPTLYYGFIKDRNGDHLLRRFSENGVTTVNLPDGSRVSLNEGASITYPAEFAHERNLELEGEAFFEVMSDPVNPFTVRSGKVMVSVLGTSFNVKKSPTSREVEVYVQSGKVRMSMEQSGAFVTLKPGELGKTDRQKLVTTDQADPNYISWKTKDFKFVDAALADVLRELEESYHVAIHSDLADIKEMRITTSYSEQSIDAILETISTAFGLNISHSEKGYYLTN